MPHPLDTNRYTTLVVRINVTLKLLNEYLELKLQTLRKEKKEKEFLVESTKDSWGLLMEGHTSELKTKPPNCS